MSDIAAVFRPGHKALIAYLTVGYPDVETTIRAAHTLAACGVDIIELGIPFSDPLADGATIQKASFEALKNGVTPEICLKVAGELHRKVEIPLVFMTYYNPVYYFGLETFCHRCHEAGISGLIVPDLPPEEGHDLEAAAQQYDLDLIYLLAPTSAEDRIAAVAARSRGFIYLVSLAGVTGVRQNLPSGLEAFVQRVRQKAAQPLCIGFGISTPQQARDIALLADGVIVGSRLIQLIEEDKTLSALKSFALDLRAALDHAAELK
jgi:tryptophan synthase alpha chain